MRNYQAHTPIWGLDENYPKKIKTRNENNNNDKFCNNSNRKYGGNQRTASLSDTSSQNFEVEERSIGVVLGLRFEKLRRKYSSIYSERRWVTKFQGP